MSSEENSNTKKQRRKPATVITPGDLELFKLLHSYRLLRRSHLSVLSGRPMKILHRRLLKLVDSHHLTRIRQPQEQHIYALGKAAIVELVEAGVASG